MTWETVLQTVSAGMAGLGLWFLYDLVREFKTFKTEAKRDIESLRAERESFKSTVRQSELTIGLRINELTKIHNDFSLKVQSKLRDFEVDIHKAAAAAQNLDEKARTFHEFFGKCLAIMKRFDLEIKTMKVQIKDLIIFKNGKGS